MRARAHACRYLGGFSPGDVEATQAHEHEDHILAEFYLTPVCCALKLSLFIQSSMCVCARQDVGGVAGSAQEETGQEGVVRHKQQGGQGRGWCGARVGMHEQPVAAATF